MTTTNDAATARNAAIAAHFSAAVSAFTTAARHLTDAGVKHHAAAAETLRSHVEATAKAHATAAATPAPVPPTPLSSMSAWMEPVAAPKAAQAPAPTVGQLPENVVTPNTPAPKPAPAAIPTDDRLAMLTTPALRQYAAANGIDVDGMSATKLRLALSAARSNAAAPAPVGKPNANVVGQLPDPTKMPAPAAPVVQPPAPASPTADAVLLTLAALAAMSGGEVAALAMKNGLAGGSVDTLRERLVAKLGLAPAPAPTAGKHGCSGRKKGDKPCDAPCVTGSSACQHHQPKSAAQSVAPTVAPATDAEIPADAVLVTLPRAALLEMFAGLTTATMVNVLGAAR